MFYFIRASTTEHELRTGKREYQIAGGIGLGVKF
jgi:hypothetical protein